MNETSDDIKEPRLWKKDGWIAKVISSDDVGWAVEMTRIGDAEPALVGPWTMGRDKVNPKPLDQSAFSTLVKTATEVMRRHEAAAHAQLHRTTTVTDDEGGRFRVDLDVARDEDDPHAILTCFDDRTGAQLRALRVAPGFKLTEKSAVKFARSGDA